MPSRFRGCDSSGLARGNHSRPVLKRRRDPRRFVSSLEGLEARLVMTVYPTTTALVGSLASGPLGASVTFTATVSSTNGVPDGSVTFEDGSTVLGTETLSGGVATLSTSTLAFGSHNIIAFYSGSSGYYASATVGVSASSTISTVAGDGTAGYSGDSGQATSAELYFPCSVAFDASGDMFISDTLNDVIREVTSGGVISTYVGTGASGYSGDGGQATSAEINTPQGLAVDSSGDLFFADSQNNVIREVNTSGIITTVVGTGSSGYSGDGGQATSAELDVPLALAFDSNGDMLIADGSNSVIREVNASGVIHTVAGNGTQGYTGDGGQATLAELNTPSSVAFDSSGDFFIADQGNNVVRKVTPAGVISSFAGNGTSGYSGDGGQAASAQLNAPTAVAFDAVGDLFIADGGNNAIREVTPSGIISTVGGTGAANYTGDGGAAGAATLNQPFGIAFDTSGDLFIADSDNNVVREVAATNSPLDYTVTTAPTSTAVAESMSTAAYGSSVTFTATVSALNFVPSGTVTFEDGSAVLGTATLFNGVATLSTSTLAVGSHQIIAVFNGSSEFFASALAGASESSTITTVAGDNASGSGYSGDGGQATVAQLNGEANVAFDASGDMYIADTSNNVIRMVTPEGIISTVAGNGSMGYTGDGGLATSAELSGPFDMAVDASGNLFIADSGNNVIREVNTLGIISTVVGTGTSGYSGDGGPASIAKLTFPASIVFDSEGDLIIADTGNNVIRKVTPSGIISTIAGNGTAWYSGDGGPATSAEFHDPFGVAIDAQGDLFIADSANNAIREVNSAGIISTIAGNGTVGYSGDGGPATSATLFDPPGVAVDAYGDVFIADQGNNAIREVSPAGVINTVVGAAGEGYSGDGGPAAVAQVAGPFGVTVGPMGNLYIADDGNSVVREMIASSSLADYTVTIDQTTTTLSATAGSRVTTLQATVLTVSGSPVNGGTVSFYDGTTLIGVAPLTNGVASYTSSPLSPGQHNLTAVFSGTDSAGTSSGLQVVSIAAATTGSPSLTGLSRYPLHHKRTLVSLFFDQTLNPAEALWKHNYRLHNNYGDRINVSHIYFDQPSSTVTLLPVHRIVLRNTYTLKLLGLNSKTGSNSSSLTATSSGWLANSFKAKINHKALSVPGAPPAITFVNGQEVATRG